MKLNLNIEFESWEEYAAFSVAMQQSFGKQPDLQSKVASTGLLTREEGKPDLPAKQSKVASRPKVKKNVVHQVNGYVPSNTVIQRVNEYIAQGKPFKTMDIAKAAASNSNYKAKINKWLKQHPDLLPCYLKVKGKGKGPLVYKPVVYESGKVILPPAETPQKAEWPIRGASYRISRHPIVEDEMELEMTELVNAVPSGKQLVS